MKYVLQILLVSLLFISCKEEVKKEPMSEESLSEFEMYQPSDMALLMRNMLDKHKVLKEKIEKGKLPTVFPKVYQNIHTATLTDPSDKDDEFDSFAKLYIENEKNLYENSTKENVKENYNAAVQSCIACHQRKCSGPIPRIKKLLIK
ncbi:hypothetical protein [Aureivirga sp. CE67]|uniref:hypothetical protein n=1 Tax=Aureivirga sp. CE67 TaxID=1788983 RepID=UPI0018CB120A|nr:hypothetical protein [Aureivirga sp. CE67]